MTKATRRPNIVPAFGPGSLRLVRILGAHSRLSDIGDMPVAVGLELADRLEAAGYRAPAAERRQQG